MNQEEKSILLRDLATRLPYGVKVYINSCIDEQNQMKLFDVDFASETIGVGNEKWAFRAIPIVDIDDNTKIVKPYLRPMSSMTEEEKRELINIGPYLVNGNNIVIGVQCNSFAQISKCQEWLNKKMFDYYGLIENGLALEAPEGMYK